MASKESYSVYCLLCPIEQKPKYVGSTSDLERRFLGHIQGPLPSVKDWILSLRSQGLMPEMEELESGLTRINSFKREKHWVLKLQKEHGTLLNQKFLYTKTPLELPIKRLSDKK